MAKNKIKEYNISFIGLKQGEHLFEYQIDSDFFELFDYKEFESVNQYVTVLLNKRSNLMELTMKSSGTLGVHCDISDEPFDLPTQGELFLVVKFGEEYNDENDELLVIPHGEHTINIAQYIYEMIVLSVPLRKVHPQIESGELKSDILDKLEELAPKIDIEESQSDEIDPRWNELRKLLNN